MPSQSERESDAAIVHEARRLVAAMPEWKRIVYAQETAYFRSIAEVARNGR